MPKADFISCRAIPSFRLDLVQAPFRFPIYFRASSVSGPSHPMRTARRLVSFRTQNRPDMQHFVFVRDRKASGLVMNVPAAASRLPDTPPQKTHMRLVRSLSIPAPHPRTDLHGFKSDFFSEAPLRTPAPKTNKKIFRLLHVFVHQTTSERGYIGAPVPPASDPARPPSSVFARMDTPDTRKGRLPPRIFVCKGARIVICLH